MEHRELLFRWLREKSYHRDDIASAVAFYDSSSKKPVDKEVLEVANRCSKLAIEESIKEIAKGRPILVKYIKMDSIPKASFFAFLAMFFGMVLGLLVKEAGLIKWALEMMQ